MRDVVSKCDDRTSTQGASFLSALIGDLFHILNQNDMIQIIIYEIYRRTPEPHTGRSTIFIYTTKSLYNKMTPCHRLTSYLVKIELCCFNEVRKNDHVCIILFYFILFCFILFYLNLFILFYLNSFYLI